MIAEINAGIFTKRCVTVNTLAPPSGRWYVQNNLEITADSRFAIITSNLSSYSGFAGTGCNGNITIIRLNFDFAAGGSKGDSFAF